MKSSLIRKNLSLCSSIPLLLFSTVSGFAVAEGKPLNVEIYEVSDKGIGSSIGSVSIHEAETGGLVFTPDLSGLQPGNHGFHVHSNPSCEPGMKDGKKAAAVAAGGHYDPEEEKAHKAPWQDGHKGDLPALSVGANGSADMPVYAPHLDMDDVRWRSLMIHQGGDNYSDKPEKFGGGGERVACGVIKKS